MTRQALKIETDGHTTVLDLDSPEGAYEVLRNGVGGWIECVAFPLCEMYVHEEGKIEGLPINPTATGVFVGHFGPVDVIQGNVVFVGPVDDEGDNTALPDNIREYLENLAKYGQNPSD